MDIRMTRNAIGTPLHKNKFLVTGPTLNIFVSTCQDKSGRVMLKRRVLTHRPGIC
jgi:hypothetical protein